MSYCYHSWLHDNRISLSPARGLQLIVIYPSLDVCAFCFLKGFVVICFLVFGGCLHFGSSFGHLTRLLGRWWWSACCSLNSYYKAAAVSVPLRKTSLGTWPWIWSQVDLNYAELHPATSWVRSLLAVSVESQWPVGGLISCNNYGGRRFPYSSLGQ